MTRQLSEEQRQAVRAAVEAAESRSGAELVPVLVESSDAYRLADWRAATLGALVAATAHAWLASGGWQAGAWWRAPLAVAAGALAGVLCAALPPLRRLLAGESELGARVDAAAGAEFLRHEVFRTVDRTGILLYVSLFERQVRLLADEGIYPSVERATWERAASDVAAEMKRGEPAEALLAAVRRAGELVARHGPRRRADDRNELPDQPVAG